MSDDAIALYEVQREGKNFFCRQGTLDEYVLNEIFNGEGCYSWLQISEGDIVVDAGANIGAFTVYAASRGARVFAYEPEPQNFFLLQKNVAANGLGSLVKASQKAITVDAKPVTLWLNVKKNKGSHQIFQRRGRTPVEVAAVSWSDALSLAGDQPFKLKCDCEGSEYPLIERNLPLLNRVSRAVFEMHINGFGVDRYMKAVGLLKSQRPKGTYNLDPGKNWVTYAYF